MDLYYDKVCVTLKEVHLSYLDWITVATARSFPKCYLRKYLECSGNGKIKTHSIPGFWSPARLVSISKSCPNLEFLSLIITTRVVHKLHTLIEGCQRLTGLEAVIYDDYAGARLGEDGWEQLEKVIPHSHPKLSEIAVQSKVGYEDIQASIKVVIDCFTEIVKRAGRRAQILVFRARHKIKSVVTNIRCDVSCS